MRKKLPLFEAIAVIIGTIIGAGVIGIPFVFAQAGFLTGIVVLLVLNAALIIMRLMVGEVVLRTSSPHQLTGYTEHYLGWWLKQAQALVLVTGILGTLLAYMVAQGDILYALFPFTIPWWPEGVSPAMFWSLLFYVLFGGLFVKGLDTVKRVELVVSLLIFVVVIVISIFSMSEVSASHLVSWDPSRFFLPFGVVLFASAGMVSVPEAREALRKQGRESLMFKAILWGGLIPPLLYLIFAFLVVGVAGSGTDPVATVSLSELGQHVLIAVNIFAFFAVGTSFLTLAIGVKEILKFDYTIPSRWASTFILAVPLVGFFFGLRDFIEIISIVGSLTVGVNGLLAVAAWWQARRLGDRQPEFTLPRWFGAVSSVFLVIVFSLGLVFAFVPDPADQAESVEDAATAGDTQEIGVEDN